jgi:serine acetyltransferase
MKHALMKSLGYSAGTGLALWLVNGFFQRVLRLDSDCPVNKHFTTRVLHPRGLVIEDNCPIVRRSFAVSGGCYIVCTDGLKIGKGTIWSANVAIVSGDHDRTDLERPLATEGIVIGQNCWIGFGAAILPGVTLGDRTFVGANAVVTESFPEGHAVIAGSPARIVKRLT